MDNGTLFYVFGGTLAASAVIVSFLGLRVQKFPGRLAPVVFLWFAILVGGATTFAVLHAKDEEHHKAAELAAESTKLEEEEDEEFEVESHDIPSGGAASEPKPTSGAEGPGATLQLAANPTQIAYDKKSLSSKPGEVTIDFDNPAPIEHDVTIEQAGDEIAASETITEGKTSVTAELSPGSYVFLCTVPGYAEASMEGTLTVK